jgi:hypothetical protein
MNGQPVLLYIQPPAGLRQNQTAKKESTADATS